MFRFIVAALLAAVSTAPACAGDFSPDVISTIRQLPTVRMAPAPFRDLKVDVEKLPTPPSSGSTVDNQGKASVPFVAPDSMILQFQPNTTPAQIDDYLSSNNLEVINKYPTIGSVQVKADLSKYFKPSLGDSSVNDSVVRGLVAASQDFKKDPRIKEATPDLVLRGQADIENFMTPTGVAAVSSKITDWGISDIQADQLWQLPGATDGTLFGVMDVGFSKHEDLVFFEFPKDAPLQDHGTHVAGIACGSHAHPKGVRGVLPNCYVRAKYGNVFFENLDNGEVARFFVQFSQILTSLTNFVDGFDDVTTFNISLGYNWIGNFGINPDAPESKEWRSLVDIQGPLLVSLLENAARKGKIIFSAAGNDSTGLNPPISARYASPFNWAALVARQSGINNGVIVEAHDEHGKRAPFSNVGGDISCPGVNILSTVAHDGHKQPSISSYGLMSGTSMASPYCAAGFVLFRLVRPGYSSGEALACLLESTRKTDANTPMLKLQDAVAACP